MSDEDVPLSAAQRSKIRRLSAPKEPEPGDVAGELNVVPYLDIITNILMFVLASVASLTATIDSTPPSQGGGKVRADISSKALNLSAWITGQGVSLKTSNGNVAPGCQDQGAGISIPKKGAAHDLTALTQCVKKLKGSRPEFQDENQVTITANPDTDYKTVIAVMDALRSDGEEELFPEAHFGVAR